MKMLLLLVVLLTLTACSTIGTKQTEIRYDPETGKALAKIVTRASAREIFESKKNVKTWEALQTEGEQGFKVGDLSQEANSTNAVAILNAIAVLIQNLPK